MDGVVVEPAFVGQSGLHRQRQRQGLLLTSDMGPNSVEANDLLLSPPVFPQ